MRPTIQRARSIRWLPSAPNIPPPCSASHHQFQGRAGSSRSPAQPVKMDVQHAADVTFLDHLAHLQPLRVEAQLVVDDGQLVRGRLRCRQHGFCLGHVKGGRLFADDMFAGLEGRDRDLLVQMGRRADAHDVDHVAGHQLLPGGIDVRDAVFLCHAPRVVRVGWRRSPEAPGRRAGKAGIWIGSVQPAPMKPTRRSVAVVMESSLSNG